MEKRSSSTFVLLVAVVLAAAMVASQLSPEPTGMASNQRPQSRISLGICYDGPRDVTPYRTTLINCCRTNVMKEGLDNYKWVYRDTTVYC